MRQGSVRNGSRLASLSTLAACAAAVLTLGAAGNAPAATSPDLAVDPSGNASFAWVGDDGRNDLIQERRRSAAGPLSDTQFVSAAGQEAGTPQVAVAPDGTATFVWRRFNGTNFIIQTVSRAPDGALSAVQNLSAAGQSANFPQVAVDPNGNASFVWQRSNGTNTVIQARRRLANGTLEAAQGISAAGQSASLPQVAVAPDGAASFVWQRSNGTNTIIQARRRLPSGTFQEVQNLSAAGQDAELPQVAVDPNGNASFAWMRFDGTIFIVQARRRIASGTLEATENLSVAGQTAVQPQVAVDPNGNASFVWFRFNGTNFIAQARRRLANGTLEATENLSAAGGGATQPQVAVAPDGAATFAWLRFNGTDQFAQTRRRLANGTFTTPQNLSAPGASATSVRVGVDQSGNASFAWERSGVIQTRRRTASLGATLDLSN